MQTENVQKSLFKTRIYMIIFLAIMLGVIIYLLNKPGNETTDDQADRQYKILMDTLRNQRNAALDELEFQQKKTAEFYRYQDSILRSEFKLNREAISKMNTNENKKRVENYSAPELSLYFSNLPRSIADGQ